MKARNMTIAKRLGMGFGLVSVFLIVVIALGLVSMRQIQNRMDEIINVNGVETRLAQTMDLTVTCLLYTSPSPRDRTRSRMPSSA